MKFKIGDTLKDYRTEFAEENSQYTLVITSVTDEEYRYDVYDNGKFATPHSFPVEKLDKIMRKLTKLERVLK